MKRLHVALLCALMASFVVMPCHGCSKTTETTTGAACSIKDLNNLYNKNTVKAKVNTTDRIDMTLRPVDIFNESHGINLYSLDCKLGICIPRLQLMTDE